MKTIYTFEISKDVNVEKVETKEENGSTISIKTLVKEKKPVFFAIKKPSRNEKEEAEMHRSVFFSMCVEKGIITQAALRKKYDDSGGVYTNDEEKEYSSLRNLLRKALEEYSFLSSSPDEENKQKAKDVFDEIFKIRQRILELENSATLFYQDTAESKARNKLIEYFILYLTYYRDSEEKEWTPFFKGNTTEEKLKHLSELEDNEDDTYLKIAERVALVITLLLSNPNISKQEIEEIEKEVV